MPSREIDAAIIKHLRPYLRELRYSIGPQIAELHTITSHSRLCAIAESCGRVITSLSFEYAASLPATSIFEVITRCQNLSKLNLSHCRAMTADVLHYITDSYHAKLTELQLAGVSQIRIETLAGELARFSALEVLDLTACQVDATVIEALQQNHHLKSLALSRTKVTSRDLESLADSAFFLEHIDLSGCYHITQDALSHILKRHFFVKMDLTDTDFANREKVADFKARYPSLTTHETGDLMRGPLVLAAYLQLYLQALFSYEINVRSSDNTLFITFSGYDQKRSPKASKDEILFSELREYLQEVQISLEMDFDVLLVQEETLVSQLLREISPLVTHFRFIPYQETRTLPMVRDWNFAKANSLSLHGTAIQDADFLRIHCPKLNWLNVTRCKALTASAFVNFPTGLVSLEAGGCSVIDFRSIAAIVTRYKKLHGFCFDVPDTLQGVQALGQDATLHVLKALSSNSSEKAQDAINAICQTIEIDSSNLFLYFPFASAKKIDPLLLKIRGWIQQNFLSIGYVAGGCVLNLSLAPEFLRSQAMLGAFVDLKTGMVKTTDGHIILHRAEALTEELVSKLFSGLSGCIAGLDFVHSVPSPVIAEAIELALTFLGKLQKLGFSNCSFPHGFLQATAKKTENLLSFSLRNCSSIMRKSIRECAKIWKSLAQLTLHDCPALKGDDFVELANSWQLRHLRLSNNSQVADSQLAKFSTNLELLDLSGTNVTDLGLQTLWRENLQLHTLRLEHTSVAFHQPLAKYVQYPLMKHLSLDYSNGISVASLDNLVMLFPILQTLSLKGCSAITEMVLFALCQKLPTLKVIDVYDIPGICPLIAQHLLHPEPQRKELILDFQHGLSSLGFELLLMRFPKLTTLHLRSAACLKNQALARALKDKAITSLTVEGFVYSDIDSFCEIGKIGVLEEFSWKGNITFRSIIGISQLKSLKKVTLINNTVQQKEEEQVNAKSMEMLGISCKKLQELTLIGFPEVTENSLHELFSQCETLKILKVTEYPTLSESFKRRMRRENFTLELLPVNAPTL